LKAQLTKAQPPKAAGQRSSAPFEAPSSHNSQRQADINTLPKFARARWSSRFLPTLYDCLGCSDNPFVINPDLLKVVQEVVDFIYPDSVYQVRVTDKFFTLVCHAESISPYSCELQLRNLSTVEGSPQQEENLFRARGYQACLRLFQGQNVSQQT
jgi:hypothetical protein